MFSDSFIGEIWGANVPRPERPEGKATKEVAKMQYERENVPKRTSQTSIILQRIFVTPSGEWWS